MNMKKDRQTLILDLVSSEEIATQDELIEQLRVRGLALTQATISRDIRELKLTKIPTGVGSYRYVAPQSGDHADNSAFRAMIAGAVRSVVASQNIIVLRTNSGLAQPVALGIDNLGLPEILGCVAGDDTVIAVARDTESAADTALRLREMLKSV